MKNFLLLVLSIFTVFTISSGKLTCSTPTASVPTGWIDIDDVCTNAVRKQIQEEINASTQYIAMGAHFSRASINRPGFAKFFFDSAKEERDHAMKLVEYLLMRGQLDYLHELIKIQPLKQDQQIWSSGVEALKSALKLETHVTKQIKNLITICQGKDTGTEDFHLVDYLTGEFLQEQYEGQRALAGKISTLDKMMQQHSSIGEFLFDKTL